MENSTLDRSVTDANIFQNLHYSNSKYQGFNFGLADVGSLHIFGLLGRYCKQLYGEFTYKSLVRTDRCLSQSESTNVLQVFDFVLLSIIIILVYFLF